MKFGSNLKFHKVISGLQKCSFCQFEIKSIPERKKKKKRKSKNQVLKITNLSFVDYQNRRPIEGSVGKKKNVFQDRQHFVLQMLEASGQDK